LEDQRQRLGTELTEVKLKATCPGGNFGQREGLKTSVYWVLAAETAEFSCGRRLQVQNQSKGVVDLGHKARRDQSDQPVEKAAVDGRQLMSQHDGISLKTGHAAGEKDTSGQGRSTGVGTNGSHFDSR
jgi:hypothetical protein